MCRFDISVLIVCFVFVHVCSCRRFGLLFRVCGMCAVFVLAFVAFVCLFRSRCLLLFRIYCVLLYCCFSCRACCLCMCFGLFWIRLFFGVSWLCLFYFLLACVACVCAFCWLSTRCLLLLRACCLLFLVVC